MWIRGATVTGYDVSILHVEPHEAVQSSATGTLGTHTQSETNINIQSLHQTEYQTLV